MNKVKKVRFASKIVVLSIICIIIYIIIDIILLCAVGDEPEITPYVFAFFGGELTLLAAKRIFTDNKTNKTEEEEEDDNL